MTQVIEMSQEEKIAMYMKCKKLELIEMLISCNNNLPKITVK